MQSAVLLVDPSCGLLTLDEPVAASVVATTMETAAAPATMRCVRRIMAALGSDELVYFEKGLFGGVCTFWACLLCGSVPGGASVDLAGAVIGAVLPSWLYVMLHV